jgi:hypothetical protein
MARALLHFRPNTSPAIGAYLHSHYVRALVDTGAPISVLDPPVASLHQFPVIGDKWVYGISPMPVHARIIEIPSVRLRGLQLGPFHAYILPLIQLGQGIEMILSINAFEDLRLEIDLKRGQLYIS